MSTTLSKRRLGLRLPGSETSLLNSHLCERLTIFADKLDFIVQIVVDEHNRTQLARSNAKVRAVRPQGHGV